MCVLAKVGGFGELVALDGYEQEPEPSQAIDEGRNPMTKAVWAIFVLLFGFTIAESRVWADEIHFARSRELGSTVVGSILYSPGAGAHGVYSTQVPKGFSDELDFAIIVGQDGNSSRPRVFDSSFPSTVAYFSADNIREYFSGLVDPSNTIVDPALYPALLRNDDFVAPSHHNSVSDPTSPAEDDDDPVYARSGEARWTGADTKSSSVVTTVIPEPASLVLLGSGLLALAGIVRHRRSG